MAKKKLEGIIWPNLPNDTYILDAGKVEYHEADTFEEDTVGEALQNKAEVDGSYESMTVGNAEQLVSNVRVNDKTPYLFRTSGGSVDIGDREYVNGIVGGTVAWNQLQANNHSKTNNDITFTYSNGALTISGTATGTAWWCTSTNTKWDWIKDHIYLVDIGNSAYDTPVGSDAPIWYIPDGFSGSWYIRKPMTIRKCSTSVSVYLQLQINTGYVVDPAVTYKPQVFDLTQMFGSTIADYIYSLETANAGAGVAWFKKLGFNKPYYAYNAGELKSVSGLVSHDMTGFNQWDEEWELGYLDAQGAEASSTNNIRSKFFDLCIGGVTYCIYNGTSTSIKFYEYDADKNYVDNWSCNAGTSRIVTTSGNTRYFKICTSAGVTTYNNDICINLAWDNSRNGEYEPYELHSYPLDTDLTLRGIPKLDANNNLYYDGDTYEADGTVTRKYGIVDLGSVDWYYYTEYQMFYLRYAIADKKAGVTNIICSKYPTSEAVWTVSNDKVCGGNGSNGTIYIRDTSLGTDPSAFKTAMSGVYLVYELDEPTEETADPYQQTEIVSDFGTEEFVISDNTFAVPVGHDTEYPIDLRAKLEMAPNSPSDGDGDYIVRQTNGVNEYVPLVIEDALPTIPSTAGTYTLTVTVADGVDPILSWEAE